MSILFLRNKISIWI